MAEKMVPGARVRSAKSDVPGRPDARGAAVAASALMLLVARPLVLGEDPGLLVDRLSDASGLTLTLLWLILGTVWAARQWASNGAKISLDRLDVAMLGLVAVVALSAGHAAYLHPARLIAWEWLVFWIVLVVVRRLARDELSRRCLLAGMLATGASISVYACYQSAVELPALRRQVQERSGAVMEELGREGISLDSDDPMLEAWRQRVMAGHAFGTFAHPNTFAGYLALLIPAACACTVFGFRERWRMRWTVAIMSLFLVVALVLTHSRGAILGVTLVALLLAWAGWNKLRARTGLAWAIPAAIAAAVVAGWMIAPSRGVDLARKSLGLRLDYWNATARMMTDPRHTDRLLIGVGPGMFGRYYPRYMNWQATEKISDPHNFILELGATSGTAALVLIILVPGIALRWCLPKAASRQVSPATPTLNPNPNLNPTPTPVSPPFGGRGQAEGGNPGTGSGTRLFLYGGIAGFVLAFGLTAMNHEPDALVGSAWIALARMLVWVVAFFAFASGVYPGRLLSLSIGAGVCACLINCLVSGGISFPALAQCLWAAIALACPASTVSTPAVSPSSPLSPRFGGRGQGQGGNRPGTYRWLLPATIGSLLVLYYVGSVYWPVMQASRYSSQARIATASWSAGKSASRSADVVSAQAIAPLEQAVNADPDDASLWVSLADGYGMLWRLNPNQEMLTKALEAARNATRIDPEGKEGYLAEYRISQRAVGRHPGVMLNQATKAMRQVIERDPSEAKWHYLLAEALRKSGQVTDAREEAEKTQQLDQLAGSGPRRLNNRSREQLERWLRESR
jgi:cytochrome c-type biogenesis protein CcmH/NrfG